MSDNNTRRNGMRINHNQKYTTKFRSKKIQQDAWLIVRDYICIIILTKRHLEDLFHFNKLLNNEQERLNWNFIPSFSRNATILRKSPHFLVKVIVAAHLRSLRSDDSLCKGHPRPIKQNLELCQYQTYFRNY